MTVKTFATDDILTAADVNTYMVGEGGAWRSWTPDVQADGDVSHTVNRADYAVFGRLVVFSVDVDIDETVSASDTTTGGLFLTLPFPAAGSMGPLGEVPSAAPSDNSTDLGQVIGVASAVRSTTAARPLRITNDGRALVAITTWASGNSFNAVGMYEAVGPTADTTLSADDQLPHTTVNDHIIGEGGAWTTYTPDIYQSGAVTTTVTSARYARFGRFIVFACELAAGSSGTANNAIVAELPVTAASVVGETVGAAMFWDDSVGRWRAGVARLSSTTRVGMNGVIGLVGESGTGMTQIASGDIVVVSGMYEAAS